MKWKEKTSNGPSGCHLDHYEYLFMNNIVKAPKEDQKKNPAFAIVRGYYQIAMVSMKICRS